MNGMIFSEVGLHYLINVDNICKIKKENPKENIRFFEFNYLDMRVEDSNSSNKILPQNPAYFNMLKLTFI